MFTPLIILIILIAVFIYVIIISINDSKEYHKEYAHIFNEHKAIGYPRLTEQQQFEILDNENLTSVSTLTKYDFVPTGLLNHYIDINPNHYFEHLQSLNLKDKIKFDAKYLRDGFFIKQTATGYEYLFVERQNIIVKKKFSTYDRLLKYLVYYKLNLYAPKKYRFAWLKKYFA